MSDLSTKFLGLQLKSPLLASASPLSESVDNIKRLEDQHLAAVVLPSLFEEQLQLESFSVDSDLARGAEAFRSRSASSPICRPTILGQMATWN
jgi:dihydroorotate dehydrogenase (fumarate)